MIYQLLIRFLAPAIFLYLLVETKKRSGGLRFFLQRIGLGYKGASNFDYWFHCASVGEIKAAEPLIELAKIKGSVLVTSSTATAHRVLYAKYNSTIAHSYLPFDWPYAINNFLNAYKPARLLIAETEIWPNLIQLTASRKIQIDIVNGRMTEKTTKAPGWLKKIYGQALKKIHLILVKSELDAANFIAVGADPYSVKVLGNIKYSAIADKTYKNPLARKFVLFASSRNEEEKIVVRQWLNLKRHELLVIVPRHPERRDEVLADLISEGVNRANIAIQSLGEKMTKHTLIFVDDRIGHLLPLFANAEVVIMGGSFVDKGGHNILEPASFEKAVIVGPYMSDFEEEVALLVSKKALVQCDSAIELGVILDSLLDNSLKAKQYGQNALDAVKSQSEVLNRYSDFLLL